MANINLKGYGITLAQKSTFREKDLRSFYAVAKET